jgi:hypothetical protein
LTIQGSGNIAFGTVYLIEIANDKISRILFANAPLRSQGSGSGWSRDTNICDRVNTFLNQSDKNFNVREARCLNINHFVIATPNNPSNALKDFSEYLRQNNLADPVIKIGAEYWLTNNNSYLRARYQFNPETVNIAPGPFERWDVTDWNKSRISSFPEKQALMERVEVFGREIQSQLELGLRGRLALGTPVNIQVAGWPVPVTPQAPPQSDAVTAPATRSPADRLRALEALKSQGVISETEFQQQRQRIIDGL